MNMKEILKQKLGLTDADFVKPLPKPSKWSLPFWEGAKQGKLLLKRCKSCGHIDHPPYLYCTSCSDEEYEWIEASGKGTLYAYAVNTYGVPFPFVEDLPYIVAMIDLEEGPRMISNIATSDFKVLKNGMPVEVFFEEVSAEVTLPKWRPVHN